VQAAPKKSDARAKGGQAGRALPKEERRIPQPASTGDVARDAVALHLAMQADVYPRLSLDGPLLPPGLDPRDVGLAHAITDAATRRWVTLERLIAKGCRQPLTKLEAHAMGALLCASAQVVLLDRVPAHAAVNHAVAWVKQALGSPAGGLVNAVMRRVVEAVGSKGVPLPADWTTTRKHLPLAGGVCVELTSELLPEDPVHAVAAATGLPRALLASFIATFGADVAHALALHSVSDAPTIINAAHDPRARAALAALVGVDQPDGHASAVVPHDRAGHFVFRGTRDELVALLDRFGPPRAGIAGSAAATSGVWVQDPASSHSLLGLLARPESAREIEGLRALGERALLADVCAGQGTKTRQLAAMFPQASVIATDIDTHRRRTLESVLGTSGRVRSVEYTSIQPRDARAKNPPPKNQPAKNQPQSARPQKTQPDAPLAAAPVSVYAGACDLLLLDVPCSNTGVLARRAEAKYRFGDHSLGQLVQVQRDVLTLSRTLLRGPGALVVYATCSLDPRENAQQARWACDKLGLTLICEELTLPAGGAASPASSYHDGAYVALLRAT